MEDHLDDIPTYTFIVMIRRTRTGYGVDVPDLDGCVATGMTVEHAKQMIAEAITMHLEGMQEAGEPIPTPRRSFEFEVDEESGEEFCTWVDVLVPLPSPQPTKKAAPKKRRAPKTAKKR